MTLPTTGPISFSQINAELGRPANSPINMNDPAVRQLAGKPTGVIRMSDLRGKSYGATLVAGYYALSMGQSIIGYSQPYSTGSLSPIPGISVQPREFKNQAGAGSLVFGANVVAEMTGKSVFINGTAYAMKTPVFYSGGNYTIWQIASGTFPIADGGTYVVRIA